MEIPWNMKKLLQGALLPFIIFTSGLLLLGCDQMQQDESEAVYSEHSQVPATKPAPSSELANGNIFYMARDVADMQYKTQGYVAKLQQAQTDLQQAIEQKDPHQLQATATILQKQLRGFSQTLSSLNLKSQEIDSIRNNILEANQQALASPLLNGEIDFNQVDFNKVQVQMNTIQTEMLKLADMLMQSSDKDTQATSEQEET